ncbi:MAG: hypothetical protein AAF311_00910 [Pseudomonadota bacterium]
MSDHARYVHEAHAEALPVKLFNVLASVSYILALAYIYDVEMLYHWRYLGFDGSVNINKLGFALTAGAGMGLLLPARKDTRALLLYVMHYAFFIPSLIITAFSDAQASYAVTWVLSYALIILVSKASFPPLIFKYTQAQNIALFCIFMTTVAIVSIAWFGGLRNFNLNLESVYDFREATALDMPAVFSYVYSSVANVFIPVALVLGVIYRDRTVVVMTVIAAIVLFGMSHHKSVFFTPFIVLGLYFVFRSRNWWALIGAGFLGAVALCLFDILWIQYLEQSTNSSIINSYIARRTLLTPPLLDRNFVEFFEYSDKYYWSSSRFGLGLVPQVYDVSAPFLIGREVFGDPLLAANTGIVGSGYSNAGRVGVAIYSVVTGLLIALLNSYGRVLGHSFTAAISVLIIAIIVTTTDLTTAVFTHGLVILIAVLAFGPRGIPSVTRPLALARA